jgi:predicted DNA-binding ribbon-helix-helix protein
MSTLVSRNVTLQGRRTSLRLERAMWDALEEICMREAQSMHDLCTHVDRIRAERTLTAGIRVFILEYYRRAATEDGHNQAGHGTLGG